MPFARRSEPISPRVWARLSAPRHGSELRDPVDGPDGFDGFDEFVDEPSVEEPSDRVEEPHEFAEFAEEASDTRRRRTPVRVDVPERLRSGRWVPSRRAVLGLGVVVLVVAVIFGARLVWARANVDSFAVAPGATRPSASVATSVDGVHAANADPASGTAASRTSPGASASVGAGRTGKVVVHVVGAVGQPGLVELAAGSRVADAIAAAGGASAEADLSAINVARLLIDGEQIRVPKPGEVVVGGAGAGPGAGPVAGGSSGVGWAGGSALISLNSADVAALDTLPGVGPVLAQRIIDWRTAHGQFRSIDELGEVTGIGEKLLAQITPLVTL